MKISAPNLSISVTVRMSIVHSLWVELLHGYHSRSPTSFEVNDLTESVWTAVVRIWTVSLLLSAQLTDMPPWDNEIMMLSSGASGCAIMSLAG